MDKIISLDLVKILTNLPDAVCLKGEFESEGLNFKELALLKYFSTFTSSLAIKISGAEATRDLEDCNYLLPRTIIVPMIESSFALIKFDMCLNNVCYDKTAHLLGFNIETITALRNYKELLDTAKKLGFYKVVIGKKDLGLSCNLNPNSYQLLTLIQACLKYAKKLGFKTTIGGNIGITTLKNMKDYPELFTNVDYVETRKIVIPLDCFNQEVLTIGLNFEIKWNQYLGTLYSRKAEACQNRIKNLKQRQV